VPDTTGGGDTINIGGDTPEQPEKQGLLGKLFGRKTTNEEQEDRWKRLREVVFGVENGNEI
jgi:hypothetical protein